MAPATDFGNDVMRPISAAESPSSSVSGPIDTSSADVCCVAYRITDTVDRKPAIVQMQVETIFGLTPVRRARSAFVAVARTASPNRVWPSSHHSPIVMMGTTMMARS